MRRRTVLAGAAAGLAGAAGCLDGPGHERLRWHTPLGDDDPTGVAVAAGVVAVTAPFEAYGVTAAGDVTWTRFSHGGPVRPLADGFLVVDAPNYHPRNATNRAVLVRVGAEGPVRWRHSLGPLSSLVGVAVDGDRAYLLYDGGRPRVDATPRLVARSLADGTRRWTRRVGGGRRGPAVARGRVVTVGDALVARDARTGVVRWRADAPASPWGPTVADGRVYLTAESPPAVRVLGRDGRERGRYDLPGDRARAPLAVVDGLGVAATTATALALDPTTGERRFAWPGPRPTAVARGPGGRVVAVDAHRRLRGVERDGRVAWTFAPDGGVSVTATAGAVAYGAGPRGLSALDA